MVVDLLHIYDNTIRWSRPHRQAGPVHQHLNVMCPQWAQQQCLVHWYSDRFAVLMAPHKLIISNRTRTVLCTALPSDGLGRQKRRKNPLSMRGARLPVSLFLSSPFTRQSMDLLLHPRLKRRGRALLRILNCTRSSELEMSRAELTVNSNSARLLFAPNLATHLTLHYIIFVLFYFYIKIKFLSQNLDWFSSFSSSFLPLIFFLKK